MAIELEVGKQYITRDGGEYTAPLEQLSDGFGDFYYIATTYKMGTTRSTATRTWTYGGSWIRNVENDLDLVAEYNPEEIKMIGKVVVNIEAGKTYRTREGKEVTLEPLEPWDVYTLTGSNGFLYNKSLTGSVYSFEHSEFDIVEEVAKEPVTTFTTQQEIYNHLANGGYVSCDGSEYLYGFAEEGVLSCFDRYGGVLEQEGLPYFNYPFGWQVATLEPKPVPRWEDALKDKKILCWVGDNENRLDILAFVMSFTERHTYPYLVESDDGDVYAFAVPLTLEEVTNYIYECE
jgi:hypothetical protein